MRHARATCELVRVLLLDYPPHHPPVLARQGIPSRQNLVVARDGAQGLVVAGEEHPALEAGSEREEGLDEFTLGTLGMRNHAAIHAVARDLPHVVRIVIQGYHGNSRGTQRPNDSKPRVVARQHESRFRITLCGANHAGSVTYPKYRYARAPAIRTTGVGSALTTECTRRVRAGWGFRRVLPIGGKQI